VTTTPPSTPSGEAGDASDAITAAVNAAIANLPIPVVQYGTVTAVTVGPPCTCSFQPPVMPGQTPTVLTNVPVAGDFIPYVGQTVIALGVGTDLWVFTSVQGGGSTDVGMIAWWEKIPPANWLQCNGSTFNPTTYPALYAFRGSNVLPNLEGVFIVGAGGSYAEGAQGGAATVTLTVAQLPSHNHPITDPDHTHPPGSGAFADITFGAGSYTITTSGSGVTAASVTGSAATGVTIGNTGSGSSVPTVPPYYALYSCIKAA